ncbi:uncharacterized protein LOC111084545, partial [Limulus polyphemus]|uniref:Uncharacterized protein LOC111084545 n=1 Tax=Limulus polyphemus TaxID=6850 RepID=A0ABM1RZY4_LIMPO
MKKKDEQTITEEKHEDTSEDKKRMFNEIKPSKKSKMVSIVAKMGEIYNNIQTQTTTDTKSLPHRIRTIKKIKLLDGTIKKQDNVKDDVKQTVTTFLKNRLRYSSVNKGNKVLNDVVKSQHLPPSNDVRKKQVLRVDDVEKTKDGYAARETTGDRAETKKQ